MAGQNGYLDQVLQQLLSATGPGQNQSYPGVGDPFGTSNQSSVLNLLQSPSLQGLLKLQQDDPARAFTAKYGLPYPGAGKV